MQRHFVIAITLGALVLTATPTSSGRGFGGFHGGGGFGGGGFGGFHGGGFGGGGFGGGDFGGNRFGGGFGGDRFSGGFDRGGFEGGGFDRSGAGGALDRNSFAGGDFDRGQLGGGFAGNRAGQFGGFDRGFGGVPPSAGRLDSFLGLPTDSGFSAAAGHESMMRYSGDAHGLSMPAAAAGGRAASATVVKGPEGGVYAHGDAAAGRAVAGPRGTAGGMRAASSTVVKGPEGGVYAHGEAAGRGFYSGARGTGTWHWSAADGRVQGNYVRANYRDYDAFGSAWYRRYPGAWYAHDYAAGVWSQASWPVINNWFGVAWPALGYSYGNDLTYQDGNVCLYGDPIATTADYYQSAASLAETGETANVPSAQPPAEGDPFAPQNGATPASAEWLPLGVFTAIPGNEKSSSMTFQLAVNKAGIIRGNYFNSSDKNAQQVQGAIDKKTQRATWVVVDRKGVIFDTGLYNLTKNESTMLVHFAADKTEQWTLVRLNKPDGNAAKQ